jgi:hypothetical protein
LALVVGRRLGESRKRGCIEGVLTDSALPMSTAMPMASISGMRQSANVIATLPDLS